MHKRPLTSLLNSRPDAWFDPEVVAALRRATRSLRDPGEKKRLASELAGEGYLLAGMDRESSAYQRLGPEHALVLRYARALLDVVWPKEVGRALWDRDHIPDADDADALIRFLEIDPFFFRSGYMKRVAIQRLKKCPVTETGRRRINQIVKRVELAGWKNQVSDWRLLAKYCESADLVELVRKGLESSDIGVRWRATELGLVVLGKTELLGRFRWMRMDWQTLMLPVVQIGMAKLCSDSPPPNPLKGA